MNIYEKLLKARLMLQAQGIKEGGKNKFADYTYFELADFVPQINLICEELKMLPMVSFSDRAVMTIVDIEKPESFVTFTSPMSTASLKGCHEVQNLGAVETYLRRYLYQTAFEIVESDFLENSVNNPAQKNDKFDKKTEDLDGYRADLEARLLNSDLPQERKDNAIKGLPSYNKTVLDSVDKMLAKRGF